MQTGPYAIITTSLREPFRKYGPNIYFTFGCAISFFVGSRICEPSSSKSMGFRPVLEDLLWRERNFNPNRFPRSQHHSFPSSISVKSHCRRRMRVPACRRRHTRAAARRSRHMRAALRHRCCPRAAAHRRRHPRAALRRRCRPRATVAAIAREPLLLLSPLRARESLPARHIRPRGPCLTIRRRYHQ